LFGQKSKRAAKVEVGTGARDASVDEWLQVCGFRFEFCVKKFPMIRCHVNLFDIFSFRIVPLPPTFFLWKNFLASIAVSSFYGDSRCN
jgi:translocon-associated protein subunit alpha